MKKLTINRVADANLRINRKAYINLFIGILVAVFLATATSLCAWGTVRGHEEQMAQRVGWMDMFMLGSDEVTDEQLRRSDFFEEIGHVTVSATAEGKTVCAGYYDETAEKLLNRTLKEGRLPEKAGEIAAEQSALIRLGLEEAQAGDTVALTMQPIGGGSEEKTFLLTGILNEQTAYLETYYEEEGMRFPALLISPEEAWRTGGRLVHRVLTYAPLITFNQVQRNCPVQLDIAYGVSREEGRLVYNDSGWERAANTLSRILIWVVLGAALMLSACVAITTSMETLLGRKSEDIGMLRAIGATRSQIRRIYGMEAWLLAATALPAGLCLGVVFTWIVSRIAPDQVVFSPSPWLLIPILGLSALCVFVASRTPLYHASRQMPMGVLRDTALLRRAGRVRSHTEFKPDRLIAGRRTRLHPLRQAGAAGMIALTLLSTLMLGELALGMRVVDDGKAADFRMNGPALTWMAEPYCQTIPENRLSREALEQLGAVDGIGRIRSVTPVTASLLMDEVPEYFRTHSFTRQDEEGAFIRQSWGVLDQGSSGFDWLFWNEEELAEARIRAEDDWEVNMNLIQIDEAAMIRALDGLAATPVPIGVYVADVDAEELREFVESGEIDPEKLDSGEQILVYAPTVCMKEEDGHYYSDAFMQPRDVKDEEWDLVIRNDVFEAGMRLELLELAGKDGEGLPWEPEESDLRNYYLDKEAVRADTTIGAVLSGPVRIVDSYMYAFSVITTPKGAEALGLILPNPEYVNIWLSGNPTPEKEAEIEEKISQTAMRAWMDVENQLKVNREYQAKKTRQVLLFAALILLFFAVSVFMQVSGTTRQIRAETRTIGTLRAVGADLEILVGCYRLPVWACAVAALVPCLVFYGVTEIPGARLFTENHPLIMVPVLIAMAACVAVACITGIRERLAAVTRESIVDNIREL
ncbi:MAG: FtsX-like permease family protein [Clostridia bacterium]|nr:FtsX-like permease family protein [Clostridia bacterium]